MLTPPAARSARITVVVLCYNHELYIEQCLDSIGAQTLTDLEMVVIDDCSTDNSRSIINDWAKKAPIRCRVVEHPQNLGLVRTLNAAIPLLTHEYGAFIGGDDWMEPDRLERQIEFLDLADERTMAVSGDSRLVDAAGNLIDITQRPVDSDEVDLSIHAPRTSDVTADDQFITLVRSHWIQSPTVTMRTEALRIAGPYDESLPFEDLQMWLRLTSMGYHLEYLPGVVTNYRKHGASLTATRQLEIVEAKMRLLLSYTGHDSERDRAIHRVVARQALALHKLGYDPVATRGHLRRAFAHVPSKWVARAVIESHLHLRPGSLALRRAR